MDKRLLRYVGDGGTISLFICGLPYTALDTLAGGDVVGSMTCGVIFTSSGVIFDYAYGPYEALRGRDGPDV